MMRSAAIFNALVGNAIDFLEQSIDQIEDNPKYSLINFYASVELFLKARLMKEHWSLVLANNCQCTFNKFIEGSFQSVTLSEANNRLKNIVSDGISDSAFTAFKRLGDDRR